MTWIQKQTSFRCSLARSFPHKLELLSILISEISDERIGKQDKRLASEPTLCPITSARSAGS